MALLWVRPVATLHLLKDDDVPVNVSVFYGLTCGLLGALVPWFSGGWSTNFTGVMVLAAAVAPLALGALFWGASTVLGSRTSTWSQSVALAAALMGVLPLAAFFQMVGSKAALGLFNGAVLPLMYCVVVGAMGLVITLEMDPIVSLGLGTFGVVAVFGGSIVSWKAERASALAEAEVMQASPPVPALIEQQAAPPPAPAPVPAPTPEPLAAEAPSSSWIVKLNSVPPGAEVFEVLDGKSRGKTPLTLEFPGSIDKVQVRLKLNKSETLKTIERHADPFVVVVMPN